LPGFERAQERLARKVERRANLARFQDVADAVLYARFMPAELILKRLVEENLLQFFNRFITEKFVSAFCDPLCCGWRYWGLNPPRFRSGRSG
jgi:hypothetical protein